jgi:hypothetical protein
MLNITVAVGQKGPSTGLWVVGCLTDLTTQPRLGLTRLGIDEFLGSCQSDS